MGRELSVLARGVRLLLIPGTSKTTRSDNGGQKAVGTGRGGDERVHGRKIGGAGRWWWFWKTLVHDGALSFRVDSLCSKLLGVYGVHALGRDGMNRTCFSSF